MLSAHSHLWQDVRDIGLGRAKDPEIALHARSNRMCILTGDWGFADIRIFPPELYSGIVILGLPDNAATPQILQVLQILLDRPAIIDHLPGRLAIVERGQVRLRPPL
jgi:predicted nuclease of predicted toxin-antitoxin system